MSLHLQRELEVLKKNILALGSKVESRLQQAVRSFETRDEALAQEVINTDYEVDQMEVDSEEECLKALALHQPVAADLRYIVAVLKINNDMERIGDLAASIAKRTLVINHHAMPELNIDLLAMSRIVEKMFSDSLDSLVNLDPILARDVISRDQDVDALNKAAYRELVEKMRSHPESIELLVQLLMVSRALERMADHATNIAEDAIYMIEGSIVRHPKRMDRLIAITPAHSETSAPK